MDVSSVAKHRLAELGLDQRDLAAAAQVTESYVSQLLTGKKAPPMPNRTDIYDKMELFLKLPKGDLARLAELQRLEELKKKLGDPPAPLLKELRELILRKCVAERQRQVRAVFEQQPFGELERLVTRKLLDVVKRVAKEELGNKDWLRTVARLSDRTYKQTRVLVLEFLDTDIYHVLIENCVAFLGPLIESWDIDLETFGMEIVLNHRVAADPVRKVEFAEREPDQPFQEEPGLREFLNDRRLSGNVTEEELEFLRQLRFDRRSPTALYYYREMQNLRDPLHFGGL